MNTIEKAEKRIEGFLHELGKPVRVYIHDDEKLYIEFSNGMNFSLSEEEINHQATEFDAENVAKYQVVWLDSHYSAKTEICKYCSQKLATKLQTAFEEFEKEIENE